MNTASLGRRAVRFACVAVLTAGSGQTCLAQSQPPSPMGETKQATSQDRPAAREAFRARLQRRLEDAKEMLGALEEAIRKLDSGSSLDDVRRMLPDRPGAGMMGQRNRDDAESDGDRRRDGGAKGPFTDEDRDAVREILASSFPEMAQRLEELRQKDPAGFQARLEEMRPGMQFLLDLRKRDPDLFRMRLDEIRTAREVVTLARQIVERRREGNIGDAEARLRSLIARQHEARLKASKHEVDDMRRRLGRREEDVARHERDRDSLIDEQYKTILERVERGEPIPDGGLRPGRPDRGQGGGPRPDKPASPPR